MEPESRYAGPRSSFLGSGNGRSSAITLCKSPGVFLLLLNNYTSEIASILKTETIRVHLRSRNRLAHCVIVSLEGVIFVCRAFEWGTTTTDKPTTKVCLLDVT